MNYLAIYYGIIRKAQEREYVIGELCEKHHITPVSCGGSNKKTNQVELTLKEHHICHLLMLRAGICTTYYFSRLSSKQYIFMKTLEKAKYERSKHKQKTRRRYKASQVSIV